jgi:hypothetical protein
MVAARGVGTKAGQDPWSPRNALGTSAERAERMAGSQRPRIARRKKTGGDPTAGNGYFNRPTYPRSEEGSRTVERRKLCRCKLEE